MLLTLVENPGMREYRQLVVCFNEVVVVLLCFVDCVLVVHFVGGGLFHFVSVTVSLLVWDVSDQCGKELYWPVD